jgi:hypothetical protein
MRGLAGATTQSNVRHFSMWIEIYDRESSTLARMLREALAADQAKQAAELTRNARFIAEHDCAAVLAINAATLTVCGSYTRWLASGRKVTGFRVENIANTRTAARDYLGY